MWRTPPPHLFTHHPLIDVWVWRLVATVNSATVTTALKSSSHSASGTWLPGGPAVCLAGTLVALSKFCLWVEGGGIFVLWIQKSKEIKQTDPESPLLKAEAAPA